MSQTNVQGTPSPPFESPMFSETSDMGVSNLVVKDVGASRVVVVHNADEGSGDTENASMECISSEKGDVEETPSWDDDEVCHVQPLADNDETTVEARPHRSSTLTVFDSDVAKIQMNDLPNVQQKSLAVPAKRLRSRSQGEIPVDLQYKWAAQQAEIKLQRLEAEHRKSQDRMKMEHYALARENIQLAHDLRVAYRGRDAAQLGLRALVQQREQLQLQRNAAVDDAHLQRAVDHQEIQRLTEKMNRSAEDIRRFQTVADAAGTNARRLDQENKNLKTQYDEDKLAWQAEINQLEAKYQSALAQCHEVKNELGFVRVELGLAQNEANEDRRTLEREYELAFHELQEKMKAFNIRRESVDNAANTEIQRLRDLLAVAEGNAKHYHDETSKLVKLRDSAMQAETRAKMAIHANSRKFDSMTLVLAHMSRELVNAEKEAAEKDEVVSKLALAESRVKDQDELLKEKENASLKLRKHYRNALSAIDGPWDFLSTDGSNPSSRWYIGEHPERNPGTSPDLDLGQASPALSSGPPSSSSSEQTLPIEQGRANRHVWDSIVVSAKSRDATARK